MPDDFSFAAIETGARDAARATSSMQGGMDHAKAEQKALERDQLRTQNHEIHGIRKRHAWLLFILASLWVYVLWLVVLLQGFGQWFIGLPWFFQLKFKLSDPVMIAFMTSTTTTVLGLYGIAAYWLYGNGNKKNGKKR